MLEDFPVYLRHPHKAIFILYSTIHYCVFRAQTVLYKLQFSTYSIYSAILNTISLLCAQILYESNIFQRYDGSSACFLNFRKK